MFRSDTIFILVFVAVIVVTLGMLVLRLWAKRRFDKTESKDNYAETSHHQGDTSEKEVLKAARVAYQRSKKSKQRQVWMAILAIILLVAIYIYQSFVMA